MFSDTCTVNSSDTYNRLALEEIETFKVQLNDVVNQVHETLAGHTDTSIANGNSDQQCKYYCMIILFYYINYLCNIYHNYHVSDGHLLDNHRLQLSERLSNLSQNLVMAIDSKSNKKTQSSNLYYSVLMIVM